MTVDELVKQAVEFCNRDFEDGTIADCAQELSDLKSAEEAGLISPDWRKSVDLPKIEREIHNNKSELLKEWQWAHEQLLREVTDGVVLGEYDVQIAMINRSIMESLARFLDPQDVETSEKLGAPFIKYLKDNKQLVLEWRKWSHPLLDHILPNHWWWNKDLDAL